MSEAPRQPVDRHEVADAFREIASLLEALGENPFKTRAYVNGARALEGMEGDLGALIASGELRRTKGFGEALVDKATTLWSTGALPYLDDLRAKVPAGLREMEAVPGLGAKKARALVEALGVAGLDDLERACREGRVAAIAGFGETSQRKILEGVQLARQHLSRRLWSGIEPPALALVQRVRGIEGVERAELGGSFRRRRETIGDLDVVAAAHDGMAAGAAFAKLPGVVEVLGHGPTSTRVRLRDGLGVDLRVVPPGRFGAALLHFTGSKDFNQALRGHAKARGMKLNEYGLFRTGDADDAAPVAAADEASVLGALGVPYLEPEMREGAEDLDEALAGPPPRLVEQRDLRGILHVHSTWSDGSCTLAEMVRGARDRGHEYVGISDHSRSAAYANGMSVEAVRRQWDELAALQASEPSIRILRGVECDILADGALDYPDELLAGFDFVIASIHSLFGMPKDEMTRRLVRAIEHPATTVVGHPSGRLLLKREGYAFDVEAVLEACARHGVAIELNAWPNRLDLDWRHLRRARRLGVLVSINPDAHSVRELDHVRYGIGIARKGWLSPEQVLNTRSADDLLRFRGTRRGR